MLKLNTERTFKAPTTVHYMDDEGVSQSGEFSARFKVVPQETLQAEENAEKRLLDLVLVDVADIELTDPNGQVLQDDALLEACKSDPSISNALVAAYSENTAKKNLKTT